MSGGLYNLNNPLHQHVRTVCRHVAGDFLRIRSRKARFSGISDWDYTRRLWFWMTGFWTILCKRGKLRRTSSRFSYISGYFCGSLNTPLTAAFLMQMMSMDTTFVRSMSIVSPKTLGFCGLLSWIEDKPRGHSSYRSRWLQEHPLTCTKRTFWQKISHFTSTNLSNAMN